MKIYKYIEMHVAKNSFELIKKYIKSRNIAMCEISQKCI